MSTRKRKLPSNSDDPNPHKKQKYDVNRPTIRSDKSFLNNSTQNGGSADELTSSLNSKPLSDENHSDDESNDDESNDNGSISDESQDEVTNTMPTITTPRNQFIQTSTPISIQPITTKQLIPTQNILVPSSQFRNTENNTNNNDHKEGEYRFNSEGSRELEAAQTHNQNNKDKENKYLLLCGAVGVILIALMATYIPYNYFFALFANTPFCDNNLDQNTMESLKCKKCPFNAQCNGGEAKCFENYVLDKYEIICLPLDDQNEYEHATNIAYTANFVLAQRLTEYECNKLDNSTIFELSEQQLTDAIFDEYYDPLQPIEIAVFDEAWDYAKTKIIPFAYKETICFDEKTSKYKTLSISPMICS